MMKLELILAIYASIVSTFVFLWRIFTYLNDKKSKLHVTQQIMTKFYTTGYEVIRSSEHRTLDISIVNHGYSLKYIERPAFKINKKTASGDTFSAITREEMNVNYPRPVKPGEKIVYSIPMDGLVEKLGEAKGANKVRSIVRDTHGKTFKSKWLKVI